MGGHDHSHDHAHGHDHSHDHGHDHDHAGHSHVSASTPTRRLAMALAITGVFMVVEIVTGFITGSLALLSDAGHMLTDAGALVMALFAQRIAQRERSRARTFGYRRAEVIAALANGVILGASSLLIIVEAVRRFGQPPEIQGVPMLVVAAIGLGLNLLSAKLLSGDGHSNANVRAAAAHVAADAAGSVAAIVAGLAIWLFNWNIVDPIVSIAISVLISWSAWKLVREAVDVLMEGAPRGVDIHALERTISATPGVASAHDLHVWSVSDGMAMATVHVVLAPGHHGTEVAASVAARVRETHHIEHVTVQPESPGPSSDLVQLKFAPKGP
jgi:cobalt-zinc-cadmium efflux system protein